MIEFKNLTKKRHDIRPFKKLYKKIFRPNFELSVVFAPHLLMKKLNMQYRGRNKPASVLSFLLEKKVRGEIFLNIKEKNLPYLFVHGALHLLGYDHQNNAMAKKMEALESKLLNK
jgi:probable rRNA maturation factor